MLVPLEPQTLESWGRRAVTDNLEGFLTRGSAPLLNIALRDEEYQNSPVSGKKNIWCFEDDHRNSEADLRDFLGMS